MKQEIKNYMNFMNEKLEEYNKTELALKEQDRTDESILFKVRANICDIFYKMITTAGNKAAAANNVGEEEQYKLFCEEYLKMFEIIPQSWKARLEKAKQHNDTITVSMEEVKLETAMLLKERFLQLTGGSLND